MAMLLDKSGEPLDDVVVLDRQDIPEPLPQSKATIAKIRLWLNPTHYAGGGSEYKKHASSHLRGTGQWAIESPIFREWRESLDQGILWIRGIPGAGKSVHAANLIKHLSQDGCAVLYFFFRHTIEANHRPEAALRDWLAQVLPLSPRLQLELKDRIKESVDELTIEDLSQLVRVALVQIPKSYCVLDGLDEMDQKALEPFLRMLDELGHWRPGEIKLIITSRPVAIVERIVRNIQLLDVRLDKELVEPDIIAYLWHRLGQSCILPESRSKVVDYIMDKADGLFLYAKLAIDAISHLKDDVEVQQALCSLPTDLTDMYSTLLQEHLHRTGIALELQILILQCVTHAIRPLRLLELSDCITVTQPQHGQDPGRLKTLVRTACGPLLEILPDETVRVVHHSLTEYLLGMIRPDDDTTAPFMLLEPGPTHARMAMLCLTYLQEGGLEQMKVKKVGRFSHLPEEVEKAIYTPFTNYSVTNWHIHIKKATALGHDTNEINDCLHQLLVKGHKDNTKKLGLVSNVESRHSRSSGRPPKAQAAALRLAIALDLDSFAENLLERYGNEIANYDADIDYSPLIFAVNRRNSAIVNSLIRHGADVNEYDTNGATPLHAAVGYWRSHRGNPRLAEILLKAGADPEKDMGEDQHVDDNTVGGRRKCPASMYAFQGKDEDMAAAFMPYLHEAKEVGRALSWAIGESGSRNPAVIARILRHPKLDINARNSSENYHFPMTPLYQACAVRDSALIRSLLAAGADPNVPHRSTENVAGEANDSGYNVLHALANRGGQYYYGNLPEVSEEETRECFRLVIAAGANVQQVGAGGTTPLHEAQGKLAARCLVEAGADVNAEDDDGDTPIHVIFDEDLLEELSDIFDIDTKSSKTGQTLLMRALDHNMYFTRRRGTKEQEINKALKLIDLGADITPVDNKGKTALHYAAEIEDAELSRLKILWQKLIDAGANIKLQDKDGQTPLHKLGFTRWGFKFIESHFVAFLDITQPDVEIPDKQGKTPLFNILDTWSYSDTSDGLVLLKLLAKAGARFDTTDLRGRTLLHAAARHCRDEITQMRFLVDQGLDPNSQDADGNTIWHEAIPQYCSWRVSPNLFRNLTALGVDLSKTNKRGRAPLHVLSEYSQWVEEGGNWEKQDDPTLLEYILGYDNAQVNLADRQGVTPLHIASTFSPFLVQRYLKEGAKAEAITTEGLNAFHLAARSRQSNIIGILTSWLQSQGDQNHLSSTIEHRDSQGRSPLYYACASGRIESVQLLIDAGALVDTDIYIGSAWHGCADFEEEQRSADWKRWDDPSYHSDNHSPAGGVLISDKLRPERRPPHGVQHLERIRFPAEHIDEIVELLIVHGAASGRKFLGEAIEFTLEKQFDYTTMCLIHAHKALGLTSTLEVQEKVRECCQRRVAACKVNHRGDRSSLSHVMARRDFEAASKALLEDPEAYLLEDAQNIGSNLEELVKGGFASLIDSSLTPEVMSKLRTASKTHNTPQPVFKELTDDESDDHDMSSDSCLAPGSAVENSVEKKKGARQEKAIKREENIRGDKTDVESDHIFAKLLAVACQTKRPNMNVLRVLIERKGINVNSAENDPHHPTQKGRTALHVLAGLRSPAWWQVYQAMPYLLGKGADTEGRDGQGMTPLLSCLEAVGTPYFSKEMAKVLLEAGADPNAFDNRARSCLSLAFGNRAMCEMLLDYGARVSPSAILAAIRSKDLELLQLMLNREGTDANMRKAGKDIRGRTSKNGIIHFPQRQDPAGPEELYPIDYLMCDVGRNDPSGVSERMFDLLVEHGANLGAKYAQTTVVHRLMQNQGSSVNTFYSGCNPFLLRTLKHPSLDVEVRDADGLTVLLHACQLGKLSAIKILLDRGANVRARDKKDRNALNLLLRSRAVSIFDNEECMNHGAISALRRDLINRMIFLAPELLAEMDTEGKLPLHCALERVPLLSSDVEVLLDAGADVRAVILKTKDSPLHLLVGGAFHIDVAENGTGIVSGERKDLLHRFLALGADINARNAIGETPAFSFFRQGSVNVTIPKSKEDEAIVQTFEPSEQHARRQDLQRKREGAAAVEHEPQLWDLFERVGMDWSATSVPGKTLLHIVAAKVSNEYMRLDAGRRPAMFRFLIGKGLDVLAEDKEHQTALDVAAALRVDDILEMFKSKD